jgi:predicted anti-sigma-YlaC factor YlaD
VTCRELDGFLADYLAGELSEEVRAAFKEHLQECPPCVDYLDAYATTVRLSREAGREEAPLPEVPEELIRVVIAARNAARD